MNRTCLKREAGKEHSGCGNEWHKQRTGSGTSQGASGTVCRVAMGRARAHVGGAKLRSWVFFPRQWEVKLTFEKKCDIKNNSVANN